VKMSCIGFLLLNSRYCLLRGLGGQIPAIGGSMKTGGWWEILIP
jgi:hypothetical protein